MKNPACLALSGLVWPCLALRHNQHKSHEANDARVTLLTSSCEKSCLFWRARPCLALRWPCLALSGLVWPCLALSGLVWPCLALSGLACACLALSGLVSACAAMRALVSACLTFVCVCGDQACLALSGLVWPCLALSGLVWPCLALSGLVWPCLGLRLSTNKTSRNHGVVVCRGRPPSARRCYQHNLCDDPPSVASPDDNDNNHAETDIILKSCPCTWSIHASGGIMAKLFSAL